MESVAFDELSQPDPQPAPLSPVARRADGTVADSASAKALGARGGRARQLNAKILRSLGLVELGADHRFHAYEAAGQQWAAAFVGSLAKAYDGIVDVGPTSIAKTAGLQLAASRFMYDEGKLSGDAAMLLRASQLGDASRTNVANALELQAREAAARKASGANAAPWILADDDNRGGKR